MGEPNQKVPLKKIAGKVDEAVGERFRNKVSKLFNLIVDPRGTREKLEDNEDLKANLYLGTQAYRLQIGKGGRAMTHLGAPLNSGVSMVSGGKVLFDSASGQADMARLRKTSPFFASYIEASGDIWRGIVPGVGTSGEEFYDVMDAPVAFYFTADTMADLLASNYGKYIANGSKLADAKGPVDSVVGGEFAPGVSGICISAEEATFLSKKGRVKVINPGISVTKVMIERGTDLAGGAIGNETVKTAYEVGGAAAGVTDFRKETRGENIRVQTKQPVYALIFSAAGGNRVTCDVQVKWNSAQGVGNQRSGRTGTLYAIPAINIGTHASDILEVMKSVIKGAPPTVVDLDAVKKHSEHAAPDAYRETIRAWAASTYHDGRFPESLPKLSDLDTMVKECIDAGRGVSECKAYISTKVRERRQIHFDSRKGSKALSKEAADRIKTFVRNDAGDDVIVDYFDSQTMTAEDMQVKVLKAVAAWATGKFGSKSFAASVDRLGQVPDTLPAAAKAINLKLLSSTEIHEVLRMVESRPRSGVEATARECEREILRLRSQDRKKHWTQQLSFGNFSMQTPGRTHTSRQSAFLGFETFIEDQRDVPGDNLVDDYVAACVTLNRLLQQAARYLTDKGIWEERQELQTQARVAIDLILVSWTDTFLAIGQSDTRRAVAATGSGADLLKYLSKFDVVRGNANKFWDWVAKKR